MNLSRKAVENMKKTQLIADMHTHSESSHDSVCKIEDMYQSQLKSGTEIFAVTDHFDTDSFNAYDVFSPIKKAYEKVSELNEKNGNDNILTGIELSEGFWHPSVYEKAIELVPYDVVIGSVHLVQYDGLTQPYSQIDFSKLAPDTVQKYLYTYFENVLTMLNTIDFDILAHLTCPLRYINGKYHLGIALSQYENLIEKILKEVIKRDLALEVNTSSFDMLNDFMPTVEILKQYKSFGGQLITLGSDAHISENASINFDKAVQALADIGFSDIYYYKKRQANKIKLERSKY